MADSTGAGTTVATTQALPTWYEQLGSQFANAIGGGVGNVSGLGQNWYQGPLVQGSDPLQNQAFNQASTAPGAWSPQYNAGWNTMQGAQPYFGAAGVAADQMTSGLGKAYGQLGSAEGIYGQAQNQAGQIGEGLGEGVSGMRSAASQLAGANPLINQMSSGMPQAQQYFNQAAGQFGRMPSTVSQVTTGLSPAQQRWGEAGSMLGSAGQMAQRAGQYDPNAMQQHLSPYRAGVLDDIERRGLERLNEKMLPAVNSTFTGAGQFGSSRNADFARRALRDTQREILGAQAQAGNQAFGQAASDYATWGGMGQRAASDVGNIAGQLANLGTTQATTQGQLYGQQAGLEGQAGQAIQGLGQTVANTPASIYGQQAGQIGQTAQQQANLASQLASLPAGIRAQMASQLGNLGGQRAALGGQYAQIPSSTFGAQAGQYGQLGGQLSSLGGQMGQYGQLGQQQNWNDINSLAALGGQRRGIGQQELDAQYQDWQSQLSTPINLMGALTQMMPNVSGLYRGNQVQTTGSNAQGGGLMDYLIAMGMGGLGGTRPTTPTTTVP